MLAVWGGGEIVGALVAGRLSDALSGPGRRGRGRKIVMVIASVLFAAGLGATWVLRSQQKDEWLAYVAALLFGLSDASLNTISTSSIDDVFTGHIRGAFVILNLVENVASAVGFFYSPFFPLVTQNVSATVVVEGTIAQIPINLGLLLYSRYCLVLVFSHDFFCRLACVTFMFVDFRSAEEEFTDVAEKK